ncbi:MAG: hypothetical protein HY791_10715 [Deltaproteobacteria bacterium]|nr:hypothetical protein [Deltaproteobacteria bacterium]
MGLRIGAVFAVLATGMAGAHAESDGLSLNPAPITDMYPHAGRWDIGVVGAGGVVFPDYRQDPNIAVFGLGGSVTRALSDRWFLTGSLQVMGGSQDVASVTVAGLLLGGGLHIAGELEDWYSLGALGGIVAVSTVISPDQIQEVQVTGAGLALALQAELRLVKWVSVVPYIIVNHLASVVVEQNGVELINADVALTTATTGFDVWLYINPENRKSHFSLGLLGTLFQPTSSFIVTLGYSFGFGGEEPAPAGPEAPPSTGLPPAVPPPPQEPDDRNALPPPVPPPPTPSPLPPAVPPPPPPKKPK